MDGSLLHLKKNLRRSYMLQINNTPQYAGVAVAGDYQELDELYEILLVIVLSLPRIAILIMDDWIFSDTGKCIEYKWSCIVKIV